MKRYLLVLTLLMGLLSLTVKAQAQENQGLSLVGSPIERVLKAKLMEGYPDGKFHPEGTLTRAQLAVIMSKTFKLGERQPKITGPVALNDVPSSHWAYPAIQEVLTRDIMAGYRPGYFYPNQQVTRAEALAIFAQAYGVFQYTDEMIKEIMANYSDAEQVPDWAEKAMATALKQGFINTDEQANRIHPLQPMARGDMAYTLSQYLNRLDSPETTPQETPSPQP